MSTVARLFRSCFGDRSAIKENAHENGNGLNGLNSLGINGTMSSQHGMDMLSPQDIDVVFKEYILDELGLEPAAKEKLLSLPCDKKLQLYLNKKKEEESHTEFSSEVYVQHVDRLSHKNHTSEEAAAAFGLLESLRVALRSQPISFVHRFVDVGGVQTLLAFLEQMDVPTRDSSIHSALIGCIQALMNNQYGRNRVLSSVENIKKITQSLRSFNVKAKSHVLEILGALCLLKGGHKLVLRSMNYFMQYSNERTRFQRLITDLDMECDNPKDEIAFKRAILSFVNVLLLKGPGEKSITFRLHLRYEFLMLGIQPVLEKLKKIGDSSVTQHINMFQSSREADERILTRTLGSHTLSMNSATGMFSALRTKLNSDMSYPYLLSILKHLLLAASQGEKRFRYFQFIDQCIQQIVLQQKVGDETDDPDGTPLHLDMSQILQNIGTESELEVEKKRSEEFMKKNYELENELAKKEHELVVLRDETTQLQHTLQKLKMQLDKESGKAYEAEKEVTRHREFIVQLQEKIKTDSEERKQLVWKLQQTQQEQQSSPNLDKRPEPTGASGETSPWFENGSSTDFGAPASCPSPQDLPPSMPPPPPPCIPVPPPPPVPPPCPVQSHSSIITRPVPKPSNPLKSFNWSKLTDHQLTGTIWVDDVTNGTIFEFLDLKDFDRTFSAYRKEPAEHCLDDHTTGKNSGALQKIKVFSVIESRRAQNCTILLSRLKMSNEDICRCAMQMDPRDEIQKDLIDQLLKFTPTTEEVQALQEHQDKLQQMDRADRFLFEVSRIPRYKNRLEAMKFIKKFRDKEADILPKVDALRNTSQTLLKSTTLMTMLHFVLDCGNYMNQGRGGNAAGIRIASLNKLVDIRSSADRNLTLLHYLVDVLQKQKPEVLNLPEQLKCVKEASKISLSDLEKQIELIRNGIRGLKEELEHHAASQLANGSSDETACDRFEEVVSKFLEQATVNFTYMEDRLKAARVLYLRCLNRFGENSSCTTDDFFSTLDGFLDSFGEAVTENETRRKRQADETKRQLIQKTLNVKRQSSTSSEQLPQIIEKQNGSTDFDDLISALQTGQAFYENPRRPGDRSPKKLSSTGDLITMRPNGNGINRRRRDQRNSLEQWQISREREAAQLGQERASREV